MIDELSTSLRSPVLPCGLFLTTSMPVHCYTVPAALIPSLCCSTTMSLCWSGKYFTLHRGITWYSAYRKAMVVPLKDKHKWLYHWKLSTNKTNSAQQPVQVEKLLLHLNKLKQKSRQAKFKQSLLSLSLDTLKSRIKACTSLLLAMADIFMALMGHKNLPLLAFKFQLPCGLAW